jgi:hypothetical protein
MGLVFVVGIGGFTRRFVLFRRVVVIRRRVARRCLVRWRLVVVRQWRNFADRATRGPRLRLWHEESPPEAIDVLPEVAIASASPNRSGSARVAPVFGDLAPPKIRHCERPPFRFIRRFHGKKYQVGIGSGGRWGVRPARERGV